MADPSFLQGDGGKWVRIVVREEGLYRVTGEDLEEAGVALQEVDSARLRLLYGGGRPLVAKGDFAPVEREERGAVVEDGGDGRFDEDDFILFYGEPASRWEYEAPSGDFRYLKNLYTDDNVFWLNVEGGARSREQKVRSGALREGEVERPESYRVRVHEEFEQFVLTQTYTVKSGYHWYWEDFRGNARYFSSFIRNGVDESLRVRFRFWDLFNTLARRAWNPQFSVKWNDTVVGDLDFQSGEPRILELEFSGGVREGLNQLGLFHANVEPARLDWYELEFSRRFVAQRGELCFFSPVTGGVGEFRVAGFSEGRPRIFELSEGLTEIVDFVYEAENGAVVFQDEAGEIPRRYVVADPSGWKRPANLELDHSGRLLQTRQGGDYLIITHGDFRTEAERLAAWRGQDVILGKPLRTKVVDIQDIYDEFSGGMLDPTAIRNFLQFAFDHWDPAPLFVLLLGDGTYDYKNNSGISAGNWIPAYQDGDSTYDEWYVRVAGDDVLPDMAIGRIPVQTAEEARAVVDKLIAYDRQLATGSWQSRMLLVADDLSNPEEPDKPEPDHLLFSEILAQEMAPVGLNLRKLYLAQFPLEGRTKPGAREEFMRRFNQGALILTYLGHGNLDVLAHEQMFVVSRDLGEVANGGRLPFFYTAASQVGVFDDPVRSSMPEALLKLPEGGVIGMISATRVGYSVSNFALARLFHERLFNSGRERVPVGLALLEAKQRVDVNPEGPYGRRNVQRYSLFGDPATCLAMPRYRVEIQVPDTLRALEEISIEGRVLDETGRLVDGFEGQAWVQAFDSSIPSRLDGLEYEQVGVALFRGFFSVFGGRFSGRFRVPKDITYRGTNGRVSAFVQGEGQPSGFGSVAGLVLAGTAAGIALDREGPEIRIGFEEREGFATGDRIPPNAVLRATIDDPSGINVTGETGHKIELTVDQESIKVTEFFRVYGDYRKGVLEYPLPALAPGEHVIGLKAWDSFNNSSQIEVVARVSEAEEVVLTDLLFYPNPLGAEEGHFTFNSVLPVRSVLIQVFSLSGRLVDQVESDARQGFNQVAWSPDPNLANGAYPYRIQLDTEEGREIARTAVIQVIK
jgi:hypothetical protein